MNTEGDIVTGGVCTKIDINGDLLAIELEFDDEDDLWERHGPLQEDNSQWLRVDDDCDVDGTDKLRNVRSNDVSAGSLSNEVRVVSAVEIGYFRCLCLHFMCAQDH